MNEAGQYDAAAELRFRIVEMLPQSADASDALGAALFAAGDVDGAQASFEAALRIDPARVTARVHLAICLRRRGQLEQAIVFFERAMSLHRSNPGAWPPALDKEAAELGLLAEAKSPRPRYCMVEHERASGPNQWLTVVVGCYGDFPEYSLRALNSVAYGKGLREHCEFIIGLNDCCNETQVRARELLDLGVADAVIDCRRNLNKDPMMRLLVEAVRTPYLLWLDDDSHFLADDWPAAFATAVVDEHPFDVAGHRAHWGPDRTEDEEYMAFIRARPWWRGDRNYPAHLRQWCPFVPGGLFIARADFLRIHDFPDRGMIKGVDDVALGELVLQVGGRSVSLSAELLSLAKINDGHRRGTNFELVDGWNHPSPAP
jgi:hypothetical protein